MRIQEGKGTILRTGHDTPLTGWLPASHVDAEAPWRTAPLLAMRILAEILGVFPGGLDLLWDLPASHLNALSHENGPKIMDLLGHLPGLRFHFCDEALGELIQGPMEAWLHSPDAPSGTLGLAWRQGWLGWIPDATDSWSLPHTAHVQAERGKPSRQNNLDTSVADRHKEPQQNNLNGTGYFGAVPNGHEPISPGCLWGELVVPLGALAHLDVSELAALLSEAQAGLERALSLRMNGGAWPRTFTFHRRTTGWRIALLGGWEYQGAGGSWEDAAARVQTLVNDLGQALRSPIHVGACANLEMAHMLGHQAMREGLPWRNSLPLPPASPAFSPCFSADPRHAVSHEGRAFFPAAMASVLSTPPVAWLRLPSVPQESAVESFLRLLRPLPAIHWLPPGIPLPGPFFHDRTWAQNHTYPILSNPTQAMQPSLFDGLDG